MLSSFFRSWNNEKKLVKIIIFRSIAKAEKRQQELDTIAASVPCDRPYISVPEAIAIYGVAKSTTVTKHIRKYGIPMRHQGNSIYVPKTEIDKLYK